MTRIKTHSWAKKRFAITKNGKVKHKKWAVSHLLMDKKKAHRNYQSWKILDSADNKRIKSLFV